MLVNNAAVAAVNVAAVVNDAEVAVICVAAVAVGVINVAGVALMTD